MKSEKSYIEIYIVVFIELKEYCISIFKKKLMKKLVYILKI